MPYEASIACHLCKAWIKVQASTAFGIAILLVYVSRAGCRNCRRKRRA